MKARTLMVAMAAVTGWYGPLHAADGIERDLHQREHAPQQAAADVATGPISFSGLVELEAGYGKADGADASSDLSVATVELGIAAQVNAWMGAEAVLLYEEGEDIALDVAQIRIAPPAGNWSLAAGRLYVPFGVFQTNMVSDPLTLALGETAETALVAGIESDGLSATAYVFNGTNSRDSGDRIDNFGLNLGYAVAGEGYELVAGVGYSNDISDSNGLQDALASNTNIDYVAGWTASLVFGSGPVTLIGEYLAAKDAIAGLAGDQPEAWNIEAGYDFALAGREATVAVGVQGSRQASALELPERRALAALSVAVLDNTALAIEVARDRAYDGTHSHSVTAQLAVEF